MTCEPRDRNPYSTEHFRLFWRLIEIDEILILYDKPLPKIVLYSGDLAR